LETTVRTIGSGEHGWPEENWPIGARNGGGLQDFTQSKNVSGSLDLGHARQVDSSMLGTYQFLKQFADRIVELHVSEVDALSRHESISLGAELAFRQLRKFIPCSVSVILESRVKEQEIDQEASKVRNALSLA
jgi:hypothetical protein